MKHSDLMEPLLVGKTSRMSCRLSPLRKSMSNLTEANLSNEILVKFHQIHELTLNGNVPFGPYEHLKHNFSCLIEPIGEN